MKRLAVAAAVALASAGFAPPPLADTLDRQAVAAPSTPFPRYEPSPHSVVRAMLKLADVGPADVLYDLGSGDGRIPIAAARDFGARAVGIDIDPRLVALARANAQKAGVADHVTFRNGNLFEADIRDASVVTLFLLPEANLKLRPRLLAELRPGTRVVSHYHDMGDWKPDRATRAHGRPLYLWTIPAR